MHSKNILVSVIFILLILVCLFSACEDDDKNNVTGDEITGWIEHERFFRSNKIILNGQVTANDYLITGLSSISNFDTTSLYPHNYAIMGGRSLTSKPAIHGKYAMFEGDQAGRFSYCWAMPTLGIYFSSFAIQDYDTTYSAEACVPVGLHTIPIGAFNDLGQFLTVIKDTNLSNSLCLIDMNETISEDNEHILDPAITKINFDTPSNGLYLHHIDSYKNSFFVSFHFSDHFVLMINELGIVTPLSDIPQPIDEFFNFQDTLLVITNTTNEIYRSTNDGFNWELWATGFNDQSTFFQVENDLCFYIYSQLFMIDLESEEILEFDNSGLEGHEITSVNQFNDYVWVTTLSGLFYRPVEDFYSLKTVDRTTSSYDNFHMLGSENSLE